MTVPRRQCGRPAYAAGLVWLAGALAACQPLPHPFAEDRPPAALLQIRDGAGVWVAPIEGKPRAAAAKLGAAVANALLKRDIPASDRTASLGSYVLHGRLDEKRGGGGKLSVSARWRLYDAEHRVVGERTADSEANTGEWESGQDAPIERLAGLSADALAPLLADEAPVEATTSGRVRVAVEPIGGAPGDGGTALADAVATVLKRQDLAIVTADQKPDLIVAGDLAVTPARAGTQHVKLVWRVRRVDGAEIGVVGQENDVPKGTLDGPWGDLAYSIAIAAGDGLMQLVARGAPAAKP